MKKRLVLAAVMLIFVLNLIFKMKADISDADMGISQRLFKASLDKGIWMCNSFVFFADGKSDAARWEQGGIGGLIWDEGWKNLSAIRIAEDEVRGEVYICEYIQETEEDISPLEKAAIAENEAAISKLHEPADEMAGEPSGFIPVTAPQAVYSREQLQDAEYIRKTFYAEDPTTQIRKGQLDFDTLMGFDAQLKQDNSKPQILLYHTHSQEAYIDSAPNDESTSIMGVGEYLCDILRTKYGYNVIHHMGKYDVEGRDYAYANAVADIEAILAENPSIEVIIDLHRDQTNADTKLVTNIQGMDMAKFMFFNGLSYTRELGELTRLPNPYVQDNLSFAFQMQLFAEEHYPGITRRTYLRGYRYNMHYRAKTLLIELGSQTNTVEEALNSCEPLAHIISEVLNGNNKLQ